MLYQRRTRKDISEEEKEAFDASMKDDGVAGKEVLRFSRDNPPGMKKKGLVDFARFVRERGERLSHNQQAGHVPTTQRAWYMPSMLRALMVMKWRRSGRSLVVFINVFAMGP